MKDEKTDIVNMHGHVKGGFLVLHAREYDHKDGDEYIYKSRDIAINPTNVICIETHDNYTKIYFNNEEREDVYESLNEILDLLEKCNGNKMKHLNG